MGEERRGGETGAGEGSVGPETGIEETVLLSLLPNGRGYPLVKIEGLLEPQEGRSHAPSIDP